MLSSFFLVLPILSLASSTFAHIRTCDSRASTFYPQLCTLLDMAISEPENLANIFYKSKYSAVVKGWDETSDVVNKVYTKGSLPIVTAHGMGDSCFNSGMRSLTRKAGNKVGAYSVCIPTGDTRISDTINGFLLNMDASVDVFAEKIRADPKLAKGFNASAYLKATI